MNVETSTEKELNGRKKDTGNTPFRLFEPFNKREISVFSLQESSTSTSTRNTFVNDSMYCVYIRILWKFIGLVCFILHVFDLRRVQCSKEKERERVSLIYKVTVHFVNDSMYIVNIYLFKEKKKRMERRAPYDLVLVHYDVGSWDLAVDGVH